MTNGGTDTSENLASLVGPDPGPLKTAEHSAFATNRSTGSMNNLIEGIERFAFDMTNFANSSIKVLLTAGDPDWIRLIAGYHSDKSLL